jgi:hypothetical protein
MTNVQKDRGGRIRAAAVDNGEGDPRRGTGGDRLPALNLSQVAPAVKAGGRHGVFTG